MPMTKLQKKIFDGIQYRMSEGKLGGPPPTGGYVDSDAESSDGEPDLEGLGIKPRDMVRFKIITNMQRIVYQYY